MTIEETIESLTTAIGALPLKERVDALNHAREALHRISPFADEPVDCVLWIRTESVRGNDWNPNTVAPPEMRLLAHSIETDGYTQPIVTCPIEEDGERIDVVVDGFHRHRVGREVKAVAERVLGYLPVTRIGEERRSKRDLMAATIRHNRARGKHGVEAMSAIVGEMTLLGWNVEQICAELGMQSDEVIRLKQITGLAALFAEREFSEAWEPDLQEKRVRSVQPAR